MKKTTILLIVSLLGAIALYFLSSARLKAYDNWYLCDIYGRVEYCKRGGE